MPGSQERANAIARQEALKISSLLDVHGVLSLPGNIAHAIRADGGSHRDTINALIDVGLAVDWAEADELLAEIY